MSEEDGTEIAADEGMIQNQNPPGEMTYPTVEEMDALLPDFQITDIIGQGGMGVVYKGWQARLERYVAIKVLPHLPGEGRSFAEQFHAEARTMAGLHHSHIATVHDFGEAGGLHYLVMEYVDGMTLFDHYHEGSFSPGQVISIVLQVCDALSYAHTHGVIHRDIKSANILIGQDGMSKLVDFGLATLQAAPGVLKKRSTAEGPAFGTPGYSPPEQFHSESHLDHRADIYSLAVVLYEGITGKTMTDAWSPPSLVDGAPRGLDGIVKKATQKNPGDRYQNVDQFATALRQLSQAPATTAAKPKASPAAAGLTTARPPVPKSSSGAPVLAILAAIAGVAACAFFLLRGDDDPAEIARPAGSGGGDLQITGVPDDGEDEPATDPDAGIGAPDPGTPEITTPPMVSEITTPVDTPPAPAEPPAELVEAEKAFESELGELDTMLALSYKQLTDKYLGALERLRTNAAPADLEAIDSEITWIKAGSPPPDTDEAELPGQIARLRPTLRTEYWKRALPVINARIELIQPHIQVLESFPQTSGAGVIVSTIEKRRQQLREWEERSEFGSRLAAAAATPGKENDSGTATVIHRSFQLSANGRETLAPRGTGLGIFAGLRGRITQPDESLFVTAPERGGSWDLVRESNHSSLYCNGLYYETPLFDFSQCELEVFDWERGGPQKTLIDGDKGFAMISGVRGRIGAGTNFSISLGENSGNWECDGKGSRRGTRVLVTNVNVGGNRMLGVNTQKFTWKGSDPDLKLIHSSKGFCVLTGISGPFDGDGEKFELRINEADGFWYIGGRTGLRGLGAEITAFLLPAK